MVISFKIGAEFLKCYYFMSGMAEHSSIFRQLVLCFIRSSMIMIEHSHKEIEK